MTAASLYSKILAHRWVFERVRPWVTGGIDMSPAYRELGAGADSIVLDVGCGMGDALNHLDAFAGYLGLDTDPKAIDVARARHGARPGTRFEVRELSDADLASYQPTHVVMVGLLHHLSDASALALLQRLARSESVERVVTLDIVFLKGRWFNNLLARLDRGRYCRTTSGYVSLVRQAGFSVLEERCVPSHPTHGRVEYFVLTLARLPEKSAAHD